MTTRAHRIVAIAAVALGACALVSCSSATTTSSDTGTVRESGSTSGSTVAGSVPQTAPGSDPAAVAVAPSGGCGAATTVVASVDEDITVDTVDSTGAPRTYIRRVPPIHDGTTPVPVVVDLHGYSEGAKIHTVMSSLGTYGDTAGFVTVTPQGEGEVAHWTAGVDSPDVAFIGDVLDDIESTLCVDTNRIYVAGLSNGAFMTSVLACTMADRFAAAAPVAGIRDPEGCDPARPVPVIAFHGTADTFVTYDGSLGASAANLPAPDGSGRTLGELGAVDPSAKGPTIPEITAAWATRNGCEPTPAEATVAADVSRLTFPCPAGAEVELYRVDAGGHAWPGSEFSSAVAATVGPTTMSINANELLWAFFQAHPLTPAP